jgi:hypothetical protein
VCAVIKAVETPTGVLSYDCCDTGISRAKVLPTGRVLTVHPAQDLVDHTCVGNDDYVFIGMAARDSMNSSQDPPTEMSIGFSPRPAEVIIGLQQVPPPKIAVLTLHARERPSFNAAAMDLLQRTQDPEVAEEAWRTGRGRFESTTERTAVQGRDCLVCEPLPKLFRLETSGMTERRIVRATQ